jgi:hypothetical protein
LQNGKYENQLEKIGSFIHPDVPLCPIADTIICPQLTKSSSNILDNARIQDKLVSLLKEHERVSSEVRDHRTNISELDYLLKQVQKEIKGLKSKGTGAEIVRSTFLYELKKKKKEF